MCGRLLCDITISAKELIKARSYDLDSLCQQVAYKRIYALNFLKYEIYNFMWFEGFRYSRGFTEKLHFR